MAKNSLPLSATIDRFENNLAVLDFGHNQPITISQKHLPPQSKAGDVLQVELLSNEQLTKRKQNLAKAILEELLNGK